MAEGCDDGQPTLAASLKNQHISLTKSRVGCLKHDWQRGSFAYTLGNTYNMFQSIITQTPVRETTAETAEDSKNSEVTTTATTIA